MTGDDGRSHEDGRSGRAAEPAPDLVSSAGDEPRAGDRLRGAMDRSGVPKWARNHHLLLGGLAGLLVMAGAATGYVVTRPPAVDPVIQISIVGIPSGGSVDLDSHGRGKRTYQVAALAADDVDNLLGVVGPGLTHPTSSIPPTRLRLPKVGTLGATVQCSDSQWWDARGADYRARVRRTDRHGRATTYDAPLGDPGAPWRTLVRQSCLGDLVQKAVAPGASSASAGAGHDQVDVTLALTNQSKHAIWLSAADYNDGIVDLRGGPWTTLAARGKASAHWSVRASDCTSDTPRLPFGRALNGNGENAKALPVYVSDTSSHSEATTVGVWARLDPASATRLDSQLAALCSSPRWAGTIHQGRKRRAPAYSLA